MSKKNKTILLVTLSVVLIGIFAVFAFGSSSSSSETVKTQDSASVTNSASMDPTKVGNYNVVIESCRLATEDLSGEECVLVKYKFTNNSDRAISFNSAIDDKAFQNGVELKEDIFYGSDSNYSSNDVYKDVKPGVTLELEVPYELNDSVTDINVELKEFFGWSNDKITKTFSIAE